KARTFGEKQSTRYCTTLAVIALARSPQPTACTGGQRSERATTMALRGVRGVRRLFAFRQTPAARSRRSGKSRPVERPSPTFFIAASNRPHSSSREVGEGAG